MRLGTWLRTATGIGFVLFVAGLFLGGFVTFDAHVYYGPPLLLAVFCVLALMCTGTLERGRFTALMWSGNVACAVSLAGWSIRLLMDRSIGYEVGLVWDRVMMAPTAWAGLCALIGLVTRDRMPSAVGLWARGVTIAAGAALAIAFPAAVVTSETLSRLDHQTLMRLVGCLAVVTGFGAIFTLIAARIRQLEGAGEDANEIRLDFTLTCPRCDETQPMVTGGAAPCRRCGLRIKVVVP